MKCPTTYKFVVCEAVTKKATTHTSPIYAMARSLTLMQIACKLSSSDWQQKENEEKVFSPNLGTNLVAGCKFVDKHNHTDVTEGTEALFIFRGKRVVVHKCGVQ